MLCCSDLCVVCGEKSIGGRGGFSLCREHWDAVEREDNRRADMERLLQRYLEQTMFAGSLGGPWACQRRLGGQGGEGRRSPAGGRARGRLAASWGVSALRAVVRAQQNVVSGR
jgi:hypothetical protein